MEFFKMDAPGPTHWTLNSSFCAFRSVWVHLWSFHNCTKHGAKRMLQLTQKFGPRSRIGHFCNERTWSTPLDTKLKFWWVSLCFGAFLIILLMYKTLSNLGWTGAIREKSSCHEVVSEFFTANAPVPPHWTINSGFGVFRGVWLHLGSFHYHTKLGANLVEVVQLVKKVRATKSCRNFSQRTHLVHPIRP